MSSLLFGTEHLYHLISDVFGLHPIDKGVEERWDQEVKVGQGDMYIWWNRRSRSVSEKGKKCKEIELEEDTHVGNTCIKGFTTCLFLGQVEDSDKYLYISEGDQKEVQATNNKSSKETIEFIDVNVFRGKLHKGHVFTVSVGYYLGSVKFQTTLYEQEAWDDQNGRPQCHPNSNMHDQLSSEYDSMPQWITDCYVAVQSHGQKDSRFNTLKCVDEPHLKEASIKMDLWQVEPKNSKHLGDNAGAKCNVRGPQHGQKDIHGFMETGFRSDDDQKQRISHQSSDVHSTEWNPNPTLYTFQTRDSNECQQGRYEHCAICNRHGYAVVSLAKGQSLPTYDSVYSDMSYSHSVTQFLNDTNSRINYIRLIYHF